jgi:anaerobic magnesium-protoporphyrin IX monomethyl ester cyclase
MKLLLTHGYFLAEDPKELRIMKPYVPLGILSLSAHLRNKGFDVEIYDSTFGSREELFRILDSDPAAALGIYGNLLTRRNVLDIAARASAAGWRVILGGPEPSNYAAEYLAAGADAIISGEGELALERIMAAGFDKSNWHSIPGLLFSAENGSVVNTGAAELISNLDEQPWPDRERVDIPRYLKVWREHHGKGSVSLITARGCPYHCNWCSHSVYGKSHRRRSPRSIAEEVQWVIERYEPDMLWFADDVFTINHGWIAEYAKEMERRRLRIPFECITRADRFNANMAETLARLGCFRVWIGSESGSQRILDSMQRGVKVEQVREAVSLSRKNGIQSGMFLMWGYEGEEISDVEATVEHVKACRPDVFFTTVSYPIKGTPYFEKVASKLVTLAGWGERTDRDVMVRGRHSRRFYQHADELLKSETAEQPNFEKIQQARQALRECVEEVEV